MANRDKIKTVILFLTPAVILYSVFFLFPMAQAFYVALFQWRGVSLDKHYVGMANFHKLLFEDPIFWAALGHNLAFLIVSVLVVIPLALFFATALNSRLRGAQTFRAIYLFPNMISIVAVAVLWAFVYHPKMGMLNAIVTTLGGRVGDNGWLGDPKTALPCVIATSIWYSLGFYIVLFLAGVQSIPRTFYEAAEIDGAGGWAQFRFVTIPLVWEILKLGLVYLIIHTINIFGLVWVMTAGGPSNHTDTLLTYLYRLAFTDSNFGYATAVGVVVFMVIFVISVSFIRLMRREAVEY